MTVGPLKSSWTWLMLQISTLITHTEVCLLDLEQRSLNSSFKRIDGEALAPRTPAQVQNIPDPADIVPVGFITIVFNQ